MEERKTTVVAWAVTMSFFVFLIFFFTIVAIAIANPHFYGRGRTDRTDTLQGLSFGCSVSTCSGSLCSSSRACLLDQGAHRYDNAAYVDAIMWGVFGPILIGIGLCVLLGFRPIRQMLKVSWCIERAPTGFGCGMIILVIFTIPIACTASVFWAPWNMSEGVLSGPSFQASQGVSPSDPNDFHFYKWRWARVDRERTAFSFLHQSDFNVATRQGATGTWCLAPIVTTSQSSETINAFAACYASVPDKQASGVWVSPLPPAEICKELCERRWNATETQDYGGVVFGWSNLVPEGRANTAREAEFSHTLKLWRSQYPTATVVENPALVVWGRNPSFYTGKSADAWVTMNATCWTLFLMWFGIATMVWVGDARCGCELMDGIYGDC